jgi:hypothetical protein
MAELKYDYNGDGKEDAKDILYQQTKTIGEDPWSDFFGKVIVKTGAGAAVGGVSGLALGGIGAVPAAIFGGLGGLAIGVGEGIRTFGQQSDDEKAKITDMLTGYYKLTEEEAAEYIKTVDVLKQLNDSTGGKINESFNAAENIINRAKQIQDNALYDSKKASSFDMIARGYGGTDTKAGRDANSQVAMRLLKDDATKLGINVDDIAVDANYAKNVEARINGYKNEYGLYNFPDMKLDIKPTAEQQAILNTGLQIATKVAGGPAAAGATPAGATPAGTTPAGTTPAGTTGSRSVPNGNGTTSTIIPNGDGTFKMNTTDDETGELISSEPALSQAELYTRGLGDTGGSGSSRNPSEYIGLNSTSPMTYTFDETGARVVANAEYTYASVDSYFNTMTETQILATKRKLYGSGYYGSGDIFFELSGNITDADKNALERAMRDSNLNGQKIDDYLAPKYATFLLTGRPVGEKPVDLNGDGEIDAADTDVTTSLQDFFSQNSLKVTDGYIDGFKNAILSGSITLEEAKAEIRKTLIAPAYPAWSDYINKGMNIADIASPYIQTMAKSLELPMDAISLNDPILKQALSGADADGKPSYMSTYDMEKLIRKDPRWQSTKAANDEYANAMNYVLTMFGIEG